MMENTMGAAVFAMVSPYGVAEKALVAELARLRDEVYSDITYSVRLGDLFGYTDQYGNTVNMYVVKHNDFLKLARIYSTLSNKMYDIKTRKDFPKQTEALPDVDFTIE